MTIKFDLDVENMSRSELEKAYFDAVFVLEELGIGDDTTMKLRARIRPIFGRARYSGQTLLGDQSILFLNILMSGRTVSHALCADIVRKTEGANLKNIAKVLACRWRSALRPWGIEIQTIWGVGYSMPRSSIATLNRLLECSPS